MVFNYEGDFLLLFLITRKKEERSRNLLGDADAIRNNIIRKKRMKSALLKPAANRRRRTNSKLGIIRRYIHPVTLLGCASTTMAIRFIQKMMTARLWTGECSRMISTR